MLIEQGPLELKGQKGRGHQIWAQGPRAQGVWNPKAWEAGRSQEVGGRTPRERERRGMAPARAGGGAVSLVPGRKQLSMPMCPSWPGVYTQCSTPGEHRQAHGGGGGLAWGML